MHDAVREKSVDRENIIKGPPGLLFGLTLLVFIGAGIYFSWASEAASASEKPAPTSDAILVQRALDLEDARIFEPTVPEP